MSRRGLHLPLSEPRLVPFCCLSASKSQRSGRHIRADESLHCSTVLRAVMQCRRGANVPASFPKATERGGAGIMPSCRRTRRPSAVFLISFTRRSLSRFAMSFSIRIKNAWIVLFRCAGPSVRALTKQELAERATRSARGGRGAEVGGQEITSAPMPAGLRSQSCLRSCSHIRMLIRPPRPCSTDFFSSR